MVWGFLHGVANVLHRAWEGTNAKLLRPLAWLATFSFVNVCWVLFRAKTMTDAVGVLRGMVGLNGLVLPKSFEGPLSFLKCTASDSLETTWTRSSESKSNCQPGRALRWLPSSS